MYLLNRQKIDKKNKEKKRKEEREWMVWDTMIDKHDELGLRYSSMMESVGEYLRSNSDYYERNGWDNEPDQLKQLRRLHDEQSLRMKGFSVRQKEEWED
jgi:hypothetical protein